MAVSAGKECGEKARELWLEGKPDEDLLLEMSGAAAVEHLIAIVNGHICGWADSLAITTLSHHSPGY
jgi:hypothetical protein